MALKRLRDEKLYRSTHKNFNDYAQEILGFTRIRLYQLIGAAEVYENLKKNVNAPLTFLPSSEYQCRPLVKLEPLKQVQAWKEALETAGEKPPTSQQVREVVLSIQGKKWVPNPYHVDEIVKIQVKDHPELVGQGGYLGVVTDVGEFSCNVKTVLGVYTLHPQHLKTADLTPDREAEAKKMVERLHDLRKNRLNDALVAHTVKYFGTKESVTPREDKLLQLLETFEESVSDN